MYHHMHYSFNSRHKSDFWHRAKWLIFYWPIFFFSLS